MGERAMVGEIEVERADGDVVVVNRRHVRAFEHLPLGLATAEPVVDAPARVALLDDLFRVDTVAELRHAQATRRRRGHVDVQEGLGWQALDEHRCSVSAWPQALCSRSGASTWTSPRSARADARAASPAAWTPSSLVTRRRAIRSSDALRKFAYLHSQSHPGSRWLVDRGGEGRSLGVWPAGVHRDTTRHPESPRAIRTASVAGVDSSRRRSDSSCGGQAGKGL